MKAKKKKVEGWTEVLPRRLTEFQATVEKQVRKGFDDVADLLPVEPRKAVKRLTADAQRMRHDLQKRAGMLRKRGDKMLADTRKRTEKLTTEIQKRMEGAISPLAKTLDLASHTEVERLRKRLEHLERRVEVRAEHSATI